MVGTEAKRIILGVVFILCITVFSAISAQRAFALSSTNSTALFSFNNPTLDDCNDNGGNMRTYYWTPMGVLIAGDGKLLVTEASSRRVLIYNTIPTIAETEADIVVGNTAPCFGVDTMSSANIFAGPMRSYYDGTRLFVADASGHRVLIYNSLPTSNFAPADVVVGQSSFTAVSSNQGGAVNANTLSTPRGVYSDGTALYIVDAGNNRVLKYNTIPTGNNASADVVIGQPNFTSNAANNDVGGRSARTLNGPRTLSISASGKLYIADTLNNRVLVYNAVPSSNYQPADIVLGQTTMTAGAVNQGGVAAANTINAPQHAVEYNGKLFVLDAGNNRLLIYHNAAVTNLAADVVIGQPDFATIAANAGGSPTAATLSAPTTISIQGTTIAVGDYNNNRVLIFDHIPTSNFEPATTVLGQPSSTSVMPFGRDALLTGLTNSVMRDIRSDGTHILVSDGANSRILIWNAMPTAPMTPPDIVIGQPDFSTALVNGGAANPTAQTFQYAASACSTGTKVAVADTGNHRVLIYNTFPTTNYPAADVVIGQPDFTTKVANNDVGGRSGRTLNSPGMVSCEHDGKLIITDRSNHRILIYNSFPTTNYAYADLVIGQANFTSGLLIVADQLQIIRCTILRTHTTMALVSLFLSTQIIVY